jgi:ribosomal protein L25 (general stress protein Ctc)
VALRTDITGLSDDIVTTASRVEREAKDVDAIIYKLHQNAEVNVHFDSKIAEKTVRRLYKSSLLVPTTRERKSGEGNYKHKIVEIKDTVDIHHDTSLNNSHLLAYA